MNFQTILEELNKLYEEADVKTTDEDVTEEDFDKEALNEAAETEEILVDDEVIEDDEAEIEAEENTDTQVVLECANCGALMLQSNADIEASEDEGLVNTNETCQYCEESKGYKILGNLVPAEESEAPLEEGIFDKFKKNKTNDSSTASGYADEDYVVIAIPQPGVYTYVQGCYPTPNKKSAEDEMEFIDRPTNNINKIPHKVVTYGEAKNLVGRSVTEALDSDEAFLDEGIFSKKDKDGYSDKDYVPLASFGSEWRYLAAPTKEVSAANTTKDQFAWNDHNKPVGSESPTYKVVKYGEAKKLVGNPYSYKTLHPAAQ